MQITLPQWLKLSPQRLVHSVRKRFFQHTHGSSCSDMIHLCFHPKNLLKREIMMSPNKRCSFLKNDELPDWMVSKKTIYLKTKPLFLADEKRSEVCLGHFKASLCTAFIHFNLVITPSLCSSPAIIKFFQTLKVNYKIIVPLQWLIHS